MQTTIPSQGASDQSNRVINNAIILSCIIETSVQVLRNIADKDVSESIQNKGMTRTLVTNSVANRIKDSLIA